MDALSTWLPGPPAAAAPTGHWLAGTVVGVGAGVAEGFGVAGAQAASSTDAVTTVGGTSARHALLIRTSLIRTPLI